MYPVVIGIKRMIAGGDAQNEWNLMMATAILAMVPPAPVVVLMQKWFVKGLVDTEKYDKILPRGRDRYRKMASQGLRRPQGQGDPRRRTPRSPMANSSSSSASAAAVTLLRMVAGLEEITGGEIASAGAWSTGWNPPSATSPWCSRTTRSTRT